MSLRPIQSIWIQQLGDLRVLRGRNVAKEARTDGLPSPSLDEFGFVVNLNGHLLVGPDRDTTRSVRSVRTLACRCCSLSFRVSDMSTGSVRRLV